MMQLTKCCITSVSAADLVSLASQVLAQNGVFWFRSRGFSMEPFIGDGEMVALQTVSIDQVQPGDILLCTPAERPILHRVTRKSVGDTTQLFLTSDVGNQVHRVDAHQVVGRLAAVKRRPARLLKWHARRAGKIMLSLLAPELASSCRQMIHLFGER